MEQQKCSEWSKTKYTGGMQTGVSENERLQSKYYEKPDTDSCFTVCFILKIKKKNYEKTPYK